MRRLVKRIAAAATALTLTIAMATTCLAAGWDSYFGYGTGGQWGMEAAEGSATSTATSWTANLVQLGYGGIWGGQMKKAVSVKKNSTYSLSFKLTSTNCDKWVYVKIAQGEAVAYGEWFRLQRGKTTTVNRIFKAKNNADQITFGVGGEFMDRDGIDDDAAIRYGFLTNAQKTITDGDATFTTQIKMTNYSLTTAKATLKSAKNVKGKKIKVSIKKVAGASKYQVQYGSKKKWATKTTYTIKGLKKGKKYAVKVRAYNATTKVYGNWSKKKTVKVKK